MLNIVLHEPEIPFNTGAIGRTCVATGSHLHLIRPYSFVLSDKYLKRAGMDYWAKLDLSEYLDFEEFTKQHPEIADEKKTDEQPWTADGNTVGGQPGAEDENRTGIHLESPDEKRGGGRSGASKEPEAVSPRLWYATTKARQVYSDVRFGPDDYIMFGKESAGIPEEILVDHPERCIRIPMGFDIRSLNLSNAAAIVLYEALRQNDFPNLERKGKLHRLTW